MSALMQLQKPPYTKEWDSALKELNLDPKKFTPQVRASINKLADGMKA
jgi:hypothetical protein